MTNKNDTNNKDEEIQTLKAKLKKEKEKSKKKAEADAVSITKLSKLVEELLSVAGKNDNESKETNIMEETLRIGCNAAYCGVLATDDESFSIVFKHHEEKDVYLSDAIRLIKDSGRKKNAQLFTNGLFYFRNDNDYARFKIRKNLDLSDDALCDLVLNGSPKEVVENIGKLTKNKKNTDILHTFTYGIMYILQNSPKKLKDWSYESRIAVEDYVGIKFDEIRSNLDAIEFVESE